MLPSLCETGHLQFLGCFRIYCSFLQGIVWFCVDFSVYLAFIRCMLLRGLLNFNVYVICVALCTHPAEIDSILNTVFYCMCLWFIYRCHLCLMGCCHVCFVIA